MTLISQKLLRKECSFYNNKARFGGYGRIGKPGFGNSGGSNLKRGYIFDGSNDYIAGDTVLGRSGYDHSIGGNIYTGTDGFGDYLNFNGNYNGGAVTGSKATTATITTPTFTQATSFSIKVRIQPTSLPSAGGSGFYGSAGDACIWIDSTGAVLFTVRGSTTVTYTGPVLSINTLYDLYLVYDSATAKFYCYVNGTLQNVGGTSGPATFTTDARTIGDNATGTGTIYSSSKAIYHACTWNAALSQAEITADVALGNTAKTDARIVQYHIPGNLQYNTQYMSNPKDFGGTGWTVRSNASVVADTTVAPDGTTTADTYTINAAGTQIANAVEQTITALTGSSLASKTFIIKAFVKVAAATAGFRLKCSHANVADYYSSNQTATTDWQEFTFTQTFTSSTSGTGVIAGLTSDTGNNAAVLQVRNVRVYLVNEIIRDESPNIGNYIGRKTGKIFSCWCEPSADGANTSDSQALITGPRMYIHIRNSTNDITVRRSDGIVARSATYSLGSGFRGRVHVLGYFYRTGSVRGLKLYINGALQSTVLATVRPPTVLTSASVRLGRSGSTYYNGRIRNPRLYTGSITDTDALNMYRGYEPANTAVKKLHWKPKLGESGVTAVDHSGNGNTGTLTNGVLRGTF